MRRSPEAAGRGAKRGLHDALDDWKAQAVDIAPLDKGTLRRGIKAEGVKGNGLNMKAEISSTAIEESGSGRFNYAYYIHELNAGGANVRREKKYLDKSAEANKDKWMRWVEEEIQKELRREGW
ncbi:HK97 gp10 family phage protein [Gottfriedia sp. S16(2024)]|uniref:HK97 gp10 family phage protein n=1 Tax=Gottfriedia sp. S16(2024) TaxID=3162883 RepID=UPI003D241576